MPFFLQQDLHITFVFFGDALASSSGGQTAIDQISCLLERFTEERRGGGQGGVELAVSGFELFPPTKQNLVAARLCFTNVEEEERFRRL
jgi:hypothetical protein